MKALLTLFVLAVLMNSAFADCTSPPGAPSQTRYDFVQHKMFICSGTDWLAIPGGGSGGFGCVLDGVVVNDGDSFDFYSASSHADCNSIKLSRGCTNGELSGSATYQYATCAAADTTPDAFSFNDVTDAPESTLTYPSPATVTITGINASTSVSVAGQGSPQISIDGGPWVLSSSILAGQTLAVRLTSAASDLVTYTATINVGGGAFTTDWTVTTAPPPCGGVEVGGYCWYYGVAGQSCSLVCTQAGLACDETATRNYAGSGGTDANCAAVLEALGAPADASISVWPVGLGCYYGGAFTGRSRGSNTTTCAASSITTYRACVCN